MSDSVDAILRISAEEYSDPQAHRREVMTGIVEAMLVLAESKNEIQDPVSIKQLTDIVRTMTEMMADADDATLSTIVENTARSLRTLQRSTRAGHITH